MYPLLQRARRRPGCAEMVRCGRHSSARREEVSSPGGPPPNPASAGQGGHLLLSSLGGGFVLPARGRPSGPSPVRGTDPPLRWAPRHATRGGGELSSPARVGGGGGGGG